MTLLFAILSSKAIVCNRALDSRTGTKTNTKEFSSEERHALIIQREKHSRKLRRLFSKTSPDNSGSTLKDRWVLNLVLCFRPRLCAHVIRGYVKVGRVAQILE